MEAHQKMIHYPAEEKGHGIEGNGKDVKEGGRFNCWSLFYILDEVVVHWQVLSVSEFHSIWEGH